MTRSLFLTACLTLLRLAAPARSTEYTVITYNIRYDNSGDGQDRWDLRRADLADAVLAQKPSIIAMQEGLVHQLEYLDKRWPRYRRFGAGREDGESRGEFAPIYYNTTLFELLNGRTIWLSETPEKPSRGWDAAHERIATLVLLRDRITGDSIQIVNTHWDHVGEQARRFSAFMMKGILSASVARGQASLVVGDLNSTPESEAIGIMAQWFEDACPDTSSEQPTFNAFGPDDPATNRIDYIWRSPGRWTVLEYRVFRPKSRGRQASDHYPVLARLSLHPADVQIR